MRLNRGACHPKCGEGSVKPTTDSSHARNDTDLPSSQSPYFGARALWYQVRSEFNAQLEAGARPTAAVGPIP